MNNNQENYTYTPSMPSVDINKNTQETAPMQQNMTQYQNNGQPQYQVQELQNNYAVYNPEYIPEEIKGWNWGAFLWNWMWLIPVNTTLAIIMFFANITTGGLSTLILAIYLGIKGNEMAWEKRQYRSIEEFKEEQKKWAISGVFCVVIPFILGVIAIITLFVLYFGLLVSIMNKMGY